MRKLVNTTTILCALVALALLGGLAGAGAARASTTQESIFQDDRLLLSSDDALRQRTLDEISSLGADTVRVLALWYHFAPSASASKKPAFDATNPGAYPPGAFDALDRLVIEARARGLGVLLDPTGPVPIWASGCRSGKHRNTCRPKAAEFQAFVTALGRRYSGSYAGLPHVSRWTVWNEPNLGSWLTPQYTGSSSHPVQASPRIYRGLFYAAAGGLAASGHSGDQLLAGEVGPIGQTGGALSTRTEAPLAFLRTLWCLDSRGKPLTGSSAKRAGCSGSFRRFEVAGVSAHPYTRAAIGSPTATARSDDLPLANVRALESLLRTAGSRGRVPGSTPVYLTEYGVQTHPPDPIGVRPSTQAAWINEAEWIAYLDPRIRSIAQFELTDPKDPNVFNTGLRFYSGKAKPALAAYRLPIWVIRAGSGVQVFGAVRRSAAGGQVQIERRASSKGKFKVAKTVSVGPGARYFRVYIGAGGGRWRLAWSSGGRGFHSREATPASR